MAKKIVTYVLMIRRVFPKTHPKAGLETFFKEKIIVGQTPDHEAHKDFTYKITTIRGNYDLWLKRAEKINRGEAVLSLRQWEDKPYKSKQKEFMQLNKIGVQKIVFYSIAQNSQLCELDGTPITRRKKSLVVSDVKITDTNFKAAFKFDEKIKGRGGQYVFDNWGILAKNDGLNSDDFARWFEKDMIKTKTFDAGVIHFTDFRYA